MPAALHGLSLFNLISAAVAPVALITSTAILLSAYSAKYSGLSGQLRALTSEYRSPQTSDTRRTNLRTQLMLFHSRVSAMWGASALLSLALLAFLVTVLSVIFSGRLVGLGIIGAGMLLIGLILIGAAVIVELYEIRLARLTIAGELIDIVSSKES